MRPQLRAWRLHLRGDTGTSFIELAVAGMVLAVAITGVVGAMGAGMGLVGHSRQRSSGSSVAQQQLEAIHNRPYTEVAIKTPPDANYPTPVQHQNDVNNPDYNVSTDGLSYKSDDTHTEPLVLSASGTIPHVDDPFTVGGTEFSVYQYVTWVDDPTIIGTQDYKRVTVVVIWKFPVTSGISHRVVESTFVTNGHIDSIAATPAPSSSASPTATPAPTATPVPTPTPTPVGPCTNDVTGPTGTMQVLSGAGAAQGFTNSTSVQVQMTPVDNCGPIAADFSNDGVNFVNNQLTGLTSGVAVTGSWTVPTGSGTKWIYVRFRDGANNVGTQYSGTVILDQIAPSVPGNLRKAANGITCSGSTRNVLLTWDASSDANFLGYRVYRNLNNAASFSVLLTSGTQSAPDNGGKKSDTVQYKVRAYDKAGNESADSNVFTIQKNQCS